MSSLATSYMGSTTALCEYMRERHQIGSGEAGATYVALTSSFAGTGGIEEAILECKVACSEALFGGDLLRVWSFLTTGIRVPQASVLRSKESQARKGSTLLVS